jgi:hypothetical protein
MAFQAASSTGEPDESEVLICQEQTRRGLVGKALRMAATIEASMAPFYSELTITEPY